MQVARAGQPASRHATTAVSRVISATLLGASLVCASLVCANAAGAQASVKSGTVPHDAAREATLLSQVKVADGYTASIFASPPIGMYPVCLTATVDGAVFACIDPNLSLTAAKGKGRVVRLVDTDHDGKADTYTVFAEMDSPRGVAFDGKTLYVMHPPTLTAYRDTNGDGIADEHEDLVTGLGFDLDFRGADHTTNGITLGIDGWIYIAVGDYGYRHAVGKDGKFIEHRGGSVVRVRTDGTGLEQYARGTRNIYDLAVDPFLHVFTRDNTNDGDGWDIRLHYLAPGANMGYPTLYKNFASEHFQSLADYGGGSGTGGLYVSDKGFGPGFGDALYTSDWLLNQVFRHPLTPKGASYAVQQESFVTVPHPADMAMDGMSNMFVASLSGGSFTYEGDTIGYIVRVRPAGGSPSVAPNIPKLTSAALVALLRAPNGDHRLQAQRELLRRKEDRNATAALKALVLDAAAPGYARVAAMFTLKQQIGSRSHVTLRSAAMAKDPQVRALALRALADNGLQLAGLESAFFIKALADTSGPVQLAAIAALVRLNATSAAGAILPLTASSDAAVAHIAINALVSLKAIPEAVGALRGGDAGVRAGALRALQLMHDTSVVSALLAAGVNERAVPQRDIVLALARLYNTEAPWKGDWWGTRPSFIGPYFAPVTWEGSPRIAQALKMALLTASATELPSLAAEFLRNRVLPQGAVPVVAASSGNATMRASVVNALVGLDKLDAVAMTAATKWAASGDAMRAAVAQLIAGESAMPEGGLPLARQAALDTKIAEDVRGKLLNMLAALPARAGLDAVTPVLASLTPAASPAGTPAAPVEAAWRRFVGDRRRLNELDYFIDLSRGATSDARTLGFAVLLQSVRGGRAPATINDKVQPVLKAAWASYEASADLVRAVKIMRLESAYAEPLAAAAARGKPPTPPASEWTQLFNGGDLKDWDIKFTGYPVGVNYRNTFRVESGLLKVAYDQWPDFNGEFGHIFYKKPFSYYVVAAEYRFVGNQVKGASPDLSWALRNNGIMVHSQSAASMGLKQDFPISLEVQILGGLSNGTRTNGNVCTPGTNIVMNDKLITTHCINSSSVTYDGDGWVRIEAMVLGDSIVKHIVNGDTVMVYNKPQMGGGAANNTNPGVLIPGKLLTEGYIALQAETAPIEFRKVEVLNLVGCMDPKSANFKPYYVKSDPASCKKK